MTRKSNIGWTEVTWNPMTGCSKISDGCKNCYAEQWSLMQKKRGIKQYRDGFKLTLAPSRLEFPLKLKKGHMIFVNSMSDLFHENVPIEFIQDVFKVMNDCPQHTFQILTKRSNRLRQLNNVLTWTENIWMGVSIENEKYIDRMADLKCSHAALKFISFEPLIGPIHSPNLNGINWIIIGGESGAKARKIEKLWIEKIIEECKKEAVPIFFKQWGKKDFNPDKEDATLDKSHQFHARGGRSLEGRIFDEYPHVN